MKVIIEKVIDGKVAKLVLVEDGVTVQVWYDNELIDESAGGTWANLNGSDLEESYLTVIANSFILSKVVDTEFEAMKGELD